MTTELVKPIIPEDIERVVMGGDLSPLTVPQKLAYYKAVCESVGLNPLTKPFDLIRFQGKEILYANKNCAEQLRNIHGISIYKLERDSSPDSYEVTAYGRNVAGREDAGLASVTITGVKGEALANAKMKCETKAKRRLTLSMTGLGMLDETEVETIPGAMKVTLPMPEIPPTMPSEATKTENPMPDTPEFEGGWTPEESVGLFPPLPNPETVKTVLDDFRADMAKADSFLQVAVRARQYTGMAQKLDVYPAMLALKIDAFLRLLEKRDADDSYSLLVPVPAGVAAEYVPEFYALDEVARKGSDPKQAFIELRPSLKIANLDKEWVAYGKALKTETDRLKKETAS